MQATARRLSVVSATSCARRRLIRNVRLNTEPIAKQRMNQQKQQGIAKNLKRLAFAELSFAEARRMAELLKQVPDTDSSVIMTSAMMAGLVTAYGRNFVSSDGMGPLSGDYSKFTDPPLQESHDTLMNARHQIYAHRDVQALSGVSAPDGEPRNAFDVFITFHDRLTGFDFDLASPQLSHHMLEDFIRLFDFQSARIRDDLKTAIEHCLQEDSYIAGHTYKLGLDFPAVQP